MKDSKIVTLIECLDNKERNEFQRFLEFKLKGRTNTYLFKLFLAIKRTAPDFAEEKLNTHRIFKKTYGQQLAPDASIPSKFHNQSNKLVEILEEFITHQELQNNPFIKKELLRKNIDERGLSDNAKKLIKEEIKGIKGNPIKSSEDYLKLFLLHAEYYEHTTTNKHIAKNEQFNTTYQNLDLFYFVYKLKLVAAAHNLKKIANYKPIQDHVFIEILLETIKRKGLIEQHLLIEYYYQLVVMMRKEGKPSIEDVNQLETLFYQLDMKQQKTDAIIGITYLINNLAFLAHYDAVTYTPRAYKILKYGFQHGLLIKNGYINHVKFQTAVTISCILDKIAEAKTLITKYQHLLPPKEQTTSLLFCKARIAFAEEDYHSTIAYINKIPIGNSQIYNRRMLLILSYFMLEEYDEMNRIIESFKQFLRTNTQVTDSKRKLYGNFIKIVGLFYDFRFKFINKEKLHAIVEKENPLVFKEWFLSLL